MGTNQSTPHCSPHHPAWLALTRACLSFLETLGSEPRSQDSEPNSISVWLAWERLRLLIYKTVCGGGGLD